LLFIYFLWALWAKLLIIVHSLAQNTLYDCIFQITWIVFSLTTQPSSKLYT